MDSVTDEDAVNVEAQAAASCPVAGAAASGAVERAAVYFAADQTVPSGSTERVEVSGVVSVVVSAVAERADANDATEAVVLNDARSAVWDVQRAVAGAIVTLRVLNVDSTTLQVNHSLGDASYHSPAR